ncbi:unnamed protein product [Calypogeia fissa]
MHFSKGDEVILMIDGVQVATGIVQKTELIDSVQRVPLQQNQIGVLIDSISKGTKKLPYPSVSAWCLSDAIDCCVIWDDSCAFLKCVNDADGQVPTGGDTDRSLFPGDKVMLSLFSKDVADGVIFKTNPEDTCHTEILGEGRVSVLVRTVFDGVHDLPYKHPGADTIEEALDSWVIWDTSQLHKLVETSTVSTSLECDVGTSNITDQRLKDFSCRSNWMLEEVILFFPDRAQEVAKSVVTLAFQTGAVDNELLGDDHVGVAVRKVLMSSYFPNIHPRVPGLVRWPIHYTMLAATKMFIGDILEKGR